MSHLEKHVVDADAKPGDTIRVRPKLSVDHTGHREKQRHQATPSPQLWVLHAEGNGVTTGHPIKSHTASCADSQGPKTQVDGNTHLCTQNHGHNLTPT